MNKKQNAEQHFFYRSLNYNASSNWVKDTNLIQRLVNIGKSDKTSSVLDLATGTGLIAEAFSKKTEFVTGLDISEEMVKKNPVKTLVLAKGEELPFREETFDICVCRQGLQFMELSATIKEIFRILKKKGRLITCHLTAYNDKDCETAFDIQRLRNPARINFFMPFELPEIVKKSGFSKLVTEEFISPESVGQWINHSAINNEDRKKIFEKYENSSSDFRELHRLSFASGDYTDFMRFEIMKAEKP